MLSRRWGPYAALAICAAGAVGGAVLAPAVAPGASPASAMAAWAKEAAPVVDDLAGAVDEVGGPLSGGDAAATASACVHATSVVAAARRTPPPPDAAIRMLWSELLADLATGFHNCAVGLRSHDTVRLRDARREVEDALRVSGALSADLARLAG